MICHCGSHGQHIRLGLGSRQGFSHLGRGLHRGAGQPFQQRWMELQRSMHQLHGRPPQTGRLGQQHPHQTGAAIAEKAGRIEGFTGGARTHQQAQTLPIALPAPEGHRLQGQKQQLRLHHPARTLAITGQQARRRGQGQHARKALQLLPVALNGPGLPHRGIHRRRRQHRRLGGQQGARQQGVGQTMHPAPQAGGTEGSQQHQLGPFGQLHMQGPWGLMAPLIGVEIAAVPAE